MGVSDTNLVRASSPCRARCAWILARVWRTTPRSAEGGDDVLGEELHLAPLLLPRHEALVEEPPEPFEITLAAERLQLLDLSFHLIDRAGKRVFGFAKPFDRPLGLRQHGRRRIFLGVARQTERLGKGEAAEIMVEPGVIGRAEECDGLLLGAAEMDRAEAPDALAEPPSAT